MHAVIRAYTGNSELALESWEGTEESSRAAAAWLNENLPDLNLQAPYVTVGDVVSSF